MPFVGPAVDEDALPGVAFAPNTGRNAVRPRKSRARHRLTTLAASLLLAGAKSAATAERPADLVVLNGRVLTVDAAFRTPEAGAIRDGVFLPGGTNPDVRALVGKATRRIDARGNSVVPGLIDSTVQT